MTASGPDQGVVLSGTGGIWRVRRDDGVTVEASLRGRVKKSNSGKRADGSLRRDTISAAANTLKLTVGDRVLLEQEGDDASAIAEILPRRSQLARRNPGGGHGERIVAANVDQVVVVFAAANPEPHPRMLDRFLVIAEANELSARIVINKVELVGGAERQGTARAGGPASRPRRRGERPHRTIGCGQVLVAQCHFPGTRPAGRRDQRVGQQGQAHHGRRFPAPAPGRRGRIRR